MSLLGLKISCHAAGNRPEKHFVISVNDPRILYDAGFKGGQAGQ